MTIPPEGTVGRLRYALGGDRPSQTTRQPLFALPLRELRVRVAPCQEWYFTVASPQPASHGSPAPTYPTHDTPRANGKL
jgi:hypothetical protein